MSLHPTLRRAFLMLTLFITVSAARAQWVAIPDTNFAICLDTLGYHSCLMGNNIVGWQLDTTCARLQSDTSLDCSFWSLINLTGIRYFKGLRYLKCAYNSLSTLPALPDSLIALDCSNNLLSSLPALPVTLTDLNCSSNQFVSLPNLRYSLLKLNCNYNQLTVPPTLPALLRSFSCASNQMGYLPSSLPAALTFLDIANNRIRSLPILPASLKYLDCSNNSLTSGLPTLPSSLDTLICRLAPIAALPSLPASLTYLDCGNNQLTSIPALPASLKNLFCYSNHLISLPGLPTSLEWLNCSDNQISSIPALPSTLHYFDCGSNALFTLPALPGGLINLGCINTQISSLQPLPASLQELYCSSNQLHLLPALPASLLRLDCSYNQISTLPALSDSLYVLICSDNPNLSCLPYVRLNSLYNFRIRNTNIRCLPDRFTAQYFDIDPDTMQLCGPASGCAFYYNLSGNIHKDTSANCLSDSINGGPLARNIKVQLKQNGHVVQQFYTSSSGLYSFKTDTLGSYEMHLDTIFGNLLSVACPVNDFRTVSLSPTDSLKVHEDFGLQCNGVDFGVLNIYANRFRPATQTKVTVTAGDLSSLFHGVSCGAHTSGTVTIAISGSAHYISPAVGALTPSVSGISLVYSIADFDAIGPRAFDIVVQTDTHTLVGSSVCITTVVQTNGGLDIDPSNDSLTQCFAVVNSYDPNLKTVYPIATVDTGAQWLTYTINFQNTGNDTAYTVVVRDTLSQYLDATSFEYLASSHNAVIQLFGNAMVFTFPKINLVDSLHNEPLSHGWIQYKVKTKPNLQLGTQIKNTASIYFDLNPAVVTNTTVNTVSIDTAHTHVSIANVDAAHVRIYPNPNSGSFTLETTNQIGMTYTLTDMLGQIVQEKMITTDRQHIDMAANATGVYTLMLRGKTGAVRVVVR